MLLGSHHSMSYLEPVSRWSKFLHFFTKSQDVDVQTQYRSYSVRVFDIRICVDNSMRVLFKNGSIVLKTDSVYGVLNFFDKMGDCYVRITLEVTDSDFINGLLLKKYCRFSEYCGIIEEIYPNVTFFGGVVNQTGELVYRFTRNKCDLKEIVMDYNSKNPFKRFFVNIFRKICPKLFVNVRNSFFYKKLLCDPSTKTYFLMDFVDVGN